MFNNRMHPAMLLQTLERDWPKRVEPKLLKNTPNWRYRGWNWFPAARLISIVKRPAILLTIATVAFHLPSPLHPAVIAVPPEITTFIPELTRPTGFTQETQIFKRWIIQTIGMKQGLRQVPFSKASQVFWISVKWRTGSPAQHFTEQNVLLFNAPHGHQRFQVVETKNDKQHLRWIGMATRTIWRLWYSWMVK